MQKSPARRPGSVLRHFLYSEAVGGTILMLSACSALAFSNSPLRRVLLRHPAPAHRRPQHPPLDQRRSDGAVLPARRSRDQARAAGRRAFHLVPAHSAGCRRRRRDGRAGADLRGVEQRKPGNASGLGGASSDRHRLRPRRDLAARPARTRFTENLPDRARDPRRSRGGRR